MLNTASPSGSSIECSGTRVGTGKLSGFPAGPLPLDRTEGVGEWDPSSSDHPGSRQPLAKTITNDDVERRETARRTSTAPSNPRRTDKTVSGGIVAAWPRRDVQRPNVFKRSNFGGTSADGTGDDRADLVGHVSNVMLE